MRALTKHQAGLLFGIAAYGIWGSFPLFFHLLAEVSPVEVLINRIIWSCLFVALLLAIFRGRQAFRPLLANRAIWRPLTLATLLLGSNWLIFIYAVSSAQVIAASLGYFLTPLVSAALAVLVLGEPLNGWRTGALVLAASGVAWRAVELGTLPWISLALALTFGCYGLVRKRAAIGALEGLFVETLILAPPALAGWFWLLLQPGALFLTDAGTSLLLVLSGILTALPLLAFAAAASRLPLMTLGFMMYLNPSLQLLSAVLLLGEPFDRAQLVSFALVWGALLLFTLDSLRRRPAL